MIITIGYNEDFRTPTENADARDLAAIVGRRVLIAITQESDRGKTTVGYWAGRFSSFSAERTGEEGRLVNVAVKIEGQARVVYLSDRTFITVL